MEPSHVFDPQSPLARAVVSAFSISLIICAAILLLVSGLITYCVWRFRAPANAPEPAQFHGHAKLEIVWTAIPFLLLVYLFIVTVRAMGASDPPAKPQDPDIIIVGHQFWWEVRYPKQGIITANEVHLPAGRKMLVRLETADVIHSFWIPQLGRKMDLIPDRANHLWLIANRPGRYQGACSEFCGVQHAWMRILAVAHAPDAFDQWVRNWQAGATTPTAPAAAQGMQVFQQLTCANCHSAPGTSLPRQAGPDLTRLSERWTLGAGVITNTPENLALWIQNPQRFKPGALMPAMILSPEQEKALLSYMLATP